MVAYIVNMFMRRSQIQAIRGRGGGNTANIRLPGYIAGLIYGPQGPCYNGVPLYSVYFMLLTLSGRRFIKIQYSSFPLFSMAYPSHIATHYNIKSSARNVR